MMIYHYVCQGRKKLLRKVENHRRSLLTLDMFYWWSRKTQCQPKRLCLRIRKSNKALEKANSNRKTTILIYAKYMMKMIHWTSDPVRFSLEAALMKLRHWDHWDKTCRTSTLIAVVGQRVLNSPGQWIFWLLLFLGIK